MGSVEDTLTLASSGTLDSHQKAPMLWEEIGVAKLAINSRFVFVFRFRVSVFGVSLVFNLPAAESTALAKRPARNST